MNTPRTLLLALLWSGAAVAQTITPGGGGGGSATPPGGTNGQAQWNNGGSFAGFTVSGDGTLNTSTGALAITKTGGVAFAASATTDTTVATNITSGTLPAAQIPNPTATTKGGIESYVGVANQWINAISTSGVPSSTQPGFSNLSGSSTLAQFPTIGANTILGNATAGTAVPSALPVGSCSGASNALIYTTSSGFGCNTISGSGTVNSGTANQLAYYATSSTAVSGLTSANSSVLVTNGSGVPAWGTSLPFVTLTGFDVTVTTQAGTTYALQATDCGTFVKFSSASAVTVTLPNSLATGCECVLEQDGAGQITLSPAAGATLHSAHSYSKTFGQYAAVGVTVNGNSGGSSAVYIMTGDGA